MSSSANVPAGATADPWDDDTRVIKAAPRHVGNVTVIGSAIQFRDGNVDAPLVVVGGGDVNPDEARKLAAALLDAAAEVEGWL